MSIVTKVYDIIKKYWAFDTIFWLLHPCLVLKHNNKLHKGTYYKTYHSIVIGLDQDIYTEWLNGNTTPPPHTHTLFNSIIMSSFNTIAFKLILPLSNRMIIWVKKNSWSSSFILVSPTTYLIFCSQLQIIHFHTNSYINFSF